MSENAVAPDAARPERVKPATWRRVVAEILIGGRHAVLIPIALGVLLLLFPVFSSDQYWIRELSLIAVLALVTSGVNLSFGIAGEIQFGQVFMFALGAYVTMIVGLHTTGEIIPLLLFGGVVAALAGGLIAAPALRIGGWSLAMASFFLVMTIPDLTVIFKQYAGGLTGLVDLPTPTLFGTALGTTGIYEACIISLILWLACFRNLVTSRYGIIFRILRQSPVLANSLGFSTFRLKFLAYTLGAFPAGVGGCLFAFITFVLTPSSFGLTLAIGVVAACILGGMESVYGVVIGAAVLQLGPESSLSFQEYAPIAYGVFLLVAAIAFRQGLAGVGKAAALKLSTALVGPAESAHTVAAGSLSAHVGHDPPPSPAAAEARAGAGHVLAPMAGEALVVEHVSKAYGGVQALQDVTLTAQPGEVTALIGSNGSGKTTLLNVVCGFAKGDAGSVRLGEAKLTGMGPHAVARRGVGRTFQTPSIPRGVSALDVVASGRFGAERCGVLASVLRLPKYWRTRRGDRDMALTMLEFVGLGALADEEATSLSLGNRRLVEVARALAGGPGLLLLDEPASGLSEAETVTLGNVIRAAADAGATVILIEHNFAFVTRLCDIAHVLHFGELIASGPALEVASDPEVIASYLGSGDADAAPVLASERRERRPAQAGPIVELHDAVTGYGDLQVLRGVSLVLEPGRIEVVLGRNGVGKTTLLGSISGQRSLWEGAVIFQGQDITKEPAHRRAAEGIALVQEGKRIFRERTIMENVVLGTHTQSLSRRERRAVCDGLLEQFPMLQERSSELAGGLSGGQQQMLAIAQALASRPRVLLLDEPSAGLAPAIVSEVFQRIAGLSEAGLTVLLVEQLADKALVIADHVTVIDNGRIVATGEPEEFHDQERLHDAYFGAAGVMD